MRERSCHIFSLLLPFQAPYKYVYVVLRWDMDSHLSEILGVGRLRDDMCRVWHEFRILGLWIEIESSDLSRWVSIDIRVLPQFFLAVTTPCWSVLDERRFAATQLRKKGLCAGMS